MRLMQENCSSYCALNAVLWTALMLSAQFSINVVIIMWMRAFERRGGPDITTLPMALNIEPFRKKISIFASPAPHLPLTTHYSCHCHLSMCCSMNRRHHRMLIRLFYYYFIFYKTIFLFPHLSLSHFQHYTISESYA